MPLDAGLVAGLASLIFCSRSIGASFPPTGFLMLNIGLCRDLPHTRHTGSEYRVVGSRAWSIHRYSLVQLRHNHTYCLRQRGKHVTQRRLRTVFTRTRHSRTGNRFGAVSGHRKLGRAVGELGGIAARTHGFFLLLSQQGWRTDSARSLLDSYLTPGDRPIVLMASRNSG